MECCKNRKQHDTRENIQTVFVIFMVASRIEILSSIKKPNALSGFLLRQFGHLEE
jgi:hypothetical protein